MKKILFVLLTVILFASCDLITTEYVFRWKELVVELHDSGDHEFCLHD